MDAVVDFCQVAFDVPPQLLLLRLFQTLKFLDEIELELHRNPGCELEGDVLVGKGAAVATGLGNDANSTSAIDPLLRSQGETVQPGLFSKPVEFDGFKTWVVEPLPNAQKLNCIAVSQPISDQIIGVLWVPMVSDVRSQYRQSRNVESPSSSQVVDVEEILGQKKGPNSLIRKARSVILDSWQEPQAGVSEESK